MFDFKEIFAYFWMMLVLGRMLMSNVNLGPEAKLSENHCTKIWENQKMYLHRPKFDLNKMAFPEFPAKFQESILDSHVSGEYQRQMKRRWVQSLSPNQI